MLNIISRIQRIIFITFFVPLIRFWFWVIFLFNIFLGFFMITEKSSFIIVIIISLVGLFGFRVLKLLLFIHLFLFFAFWVATTADWLNAGMLHLWLGLLFRLCCVPILLRITSSLAVAMFGLALLFNIYNRGSFAGGIRLIILAACLLVTLEVCWGYCDVLRLDSQLLSVHLLGRDP